MNMKTPNLIREHRLRDGWKRRFIYICTFKLCHSPNRNGQLLFYKSAQARTYLQLPLRQWGAGNVYLLVLSSWKVNIAENPIAVMGL